ncbi:MAG: peptidase M17 [Marinilabiliales bacterium]|nr:MAG: peptidase M17 [Marinilabiliales bacterium]
MHRSKSGLVEINRFKNHLFIVFCDGQGTKVERAENLRKLGSDTQAAIIKNKIERVVIQSVGGVKEDAFNLAEGLLLSNYRFSKYITDSERAENCFNQLDIYCNDASEDDIEELRILTEAVYITRDLVNEPVQYLTAEQFAKEFKLLGKDAGFKVDVFNKKKIESLKMGGLLAVNRGSIDPPTFTIMEWKPENAVNKQPYVFVGKGVVYDTGGLSLKPSNFMDTMKCDMGGGAAVAGAIYAIAKAKVPVHVISIVPATDNRPDGNAYTPGDVITMFDGSTVEVLNTDAEGRMILADALSYAKKFNPEMVIDMATLTGAAARAIGPNAIVGMQAKCESGFADLQKAGSRVHERLVEFPLWDEYKSQLKSEIADMKNIGGAEAGAITAGKFLEHFTDYPYIHLDIAGPAFISKKDNYRTAGGTGIGVRLLYDFIKSKVQ